jgi:glycosyltransferase involved in cell wall biosynthesis
MSEPAGRRIVIVAPVRDEAEYLQGTIDSIVAQKLKPVEWLLVDDGSTDDTYAIAERASREHPWIRVIKRQDRGVRAVGPGVVEAFYFGYDQILTTDYDFICKMDGDIEIGPDYFSTLVDYFEKDPQLGAASGKIFLEEGGGLVEERASDEMVAGMVNFYRRQAFQAIGGFVRQVHWDGIAYHKARITGWRTRSIRNPKLAIIHKRLMGSSHQGIWHGRMRWGRGQYFMGTHPVYIIPMGVYRMAEKPFVIGGLGIICGYFKALLEGMQRYEDPGFRESLHAWQFEKLKIGTRLEKIPEPPVGLYP